MSTVQRVNFEPVSDITGVTRRDFVLADGSLVNPNNAVCLVDGEWMVLDSTAGLTQGKAKRATNIAVVGDLATTLCFPHWAERGRYDLQAAAEKKSVFLYMGQYEFDTRIFDASASVGGAAITTLYQPIRVATITQNLAEGGSRNFTGLVGSTYTTNGPIVGYVTKLPVNGRLRFMQGWAVQNGAT